jgi:hypothetical protein
MPRSSKWSLSFRFPHQNLACISLLPHQCHMSRQSYSWYDQQDNEATHSAIFPSLLSHPLSFTQTFFSASRYQIVHAYGILTLKKDCFTPTQLLTNLFKLVCCNRPGFGVRISDISGMSYAFFWVMPLRL